MSPKLAKLYQTWNKKLKASGFEDVEEPQSPREMLKRWHGHYFRTRMTPLEFDAKQTYYYLAEHFLTSHEFKTAREKKIWALHAEGRDARDIAKQVRRGKTTVQVTINRLKEIMLHGSASKVK